MLSKVIPLLFFVVLGISSVSAADCTGDLIVVSTPNGFGSNLASENFALSEGRAGFIVGSDVGYLFYVDCSGNAIQLTSYNTSKFVTGVKYNPNDGLIYALFTNFPPQFNTANQSFVGVFKKDGTAVAYLDLTPLSNITKGSLVNDLYFRNAHVFITDSLSNRIYVVHTDNLQAAVWSESSLYEGTPMPQVGGLSIGLEGLFSPAGAQYVVASKFSDGSNYNPGIILLRVSDSHPNTPSVIPVGGLNATLEGGLDGLWYDTNNCLLYGANLQGKVFRFYSADDWRTAVLDDVAWVPAVQNKAALGPTVSVVLTSQGLIYALDAGGFNPKGQGTISKVNFPTEPTSHCGSRK